MVFYKVVVRRFVKVGMLFEGSFREGFVFKLIYMIVGWIDFIEGCLIEGFSFLLVLVRVCF